jgi:hypothetical protein
MKMLPGRVERSQAKETRNRQFASSYIGLRRQGHEAHVQDDPLTHRYFMQNIWVSADPSNGCFQRLYVCWGRQVLRRAGLSARRGFVEPCANAQCLSSLPAESVDKILCVNASSTASHSSRHAGRAERPSAMDIGLRSTTHGVGYRDDVNFFVRSVPAEQQRPVEMAHSRSAPAFTRCGSQTTSACRSYPPARMSPTSPASAPIVAPHA